MVQSGKHSENMREIADSIIKGVKAEDEYTSYKEMEQEGVHCFYPVVNGIDVFLDVEVEDGFKGVTVSNIELDAESLAYVQKEVIGYLTTRYGELKKEWEEENWERLRDDEISHYEDMAFDAKRDRELT